MVDNNIDEVELPNEVPGVSQVGGGGQQYQGGGAGTPVTYMDRDGL